MRSRSEEIVEPKTKLSSAGWAAAPSRRLHVLAQFVRLKSRRGPKRVVMVVAASILTAAYYMLRDGKQHRDLDADYSNRRDRASVVHRLSRRIEALGYHLEAHQVA